MDKVVEREIDIKRIVVELLYKSWAIVLAVLIGATGGFTYSKVFVTPKYTATAMMYVNNFASDVQDAVIRMTNSDIYTSQALAQTCITFLSSDKILASVADELGGKYEVGEIRSMMSTQSLDDTELFTIKITHPSPKEAEKIANLIADNAVTTVSEYIEGSTIKIVDRATIPEASSYPRVSKFTMVGGVMGGGLAALIIVLLYLLNGKITSEADLKMLFDAPVIGRIPNFRQVYSEACLYDYAYKYGYGYNQKKKKRGEKK